MNSKGIDTTTILTELGLPYDAFDISGSWIKAAVIDLSKTLILMSESDKYLIGGCLLTPGEYREYLIYLYEYILSVINAAKTLNSAVRDESKGFQNYVGRKTIRYLSERLIKLNEYEDKYIYLKDLSNMVSPSVKVAVHLLESKGMFVRVKSIEESLHRWDTVIKRAFEVGSFRRSQWLNIFIIILTLATVILGIIAFCNIFTR
jgi:hypothetical protein